MQEVKEVKRKVKSQEASKARLLKELRTCEKYRTMLSIAEGRVNFIPSSISMVNAGIDLEASLGAHKNRALKGFAGLREQIELYIYCIERLILENEGE